MRSVLGKGLDALISEEPQVATEIPISRIQPNPKQPRQVYSESALRELAESIRQRGVLQPILVAPTEGGNYQIIVGERRWRAAQRAGLSSIPAMIKSAPEMERFEMALIENIQREDLNALEQAQGFSRLANEYQMTQDQIAGIIGKDRAVVANTLRLLNLPAEMQSALTEGKISASHARAIVALDEPVAQQSLFKRILTEELSVRAVEHAVRAHKRTSAHGNPQGKAKPPEVKALEEDLQRTLSRKVELQIPSSSPTKGWVRLEFYSLDDLDHLVAQLKGN